MDVSKSTSTVLVTICKHRQLETFFLADQQKSDDRYRYHTWNEGHTSNEAKAVKPIAKSVEYGEVHRNARVRHGQHRLSLLSELRLVLHASAPWDQFSSVLLS